MMRIVALLLRLYVRYFLELSLLADDNRTHASFTLHGVNDEKYPYSYKWTSIRNILKNDYSTDRF